MGVVRCGGKRFGSFATGAVGAIDQSLVVNLPTLRVVPCRTMDAQLFERDGPSELPPSSITPGNNGCFSGKHGRGAGCARLFRQPGFPCREAEGFGQCSVVPQGQRCQGWPTR